MPTSGQASYLGNGASPNARGSVSGVIYGAVALAPRPLPSAAPPSFSVNFASGQVARHPVGFAGDAAFQWSRGPAAGLEPDQHHRQPGGRGSGGSTSTPSQPAGSLGFAATATGRIDGALYGPNAQELGAVWSLQDKTGFKTAFGVVAATKQ